MVHMASVWVPFTSESKEAIASYPEIQKEIRLALQAVGRKLGMYLRRRLKVAQEGQRRTIFLRYLGEVATAVATINGGDREKIYEELLRVAKKKTSEADIKLDESGQPLDEPEELNLGDNVIIVSEHDHQKPTDNGEDSETKTKTKRKTKKKVKRKVVKKRRVKK
jgi:DNA topoisomerase-6 subunit B